MSPLPILAIVSAGVRRDLHAPLKFFSRFKPAHFFRINAYADMTADDLAIPLTPYASPRDLYRKLVNVNADIIQSVEPFSLRLQPYLWACYFAAIKTRARLIAVAFENRPLDARFGKPLAWVLRVELKFFFARADLVIVPNEGARLNALACGAPDARVVKMLWGTWGVDPEEFSPRVGEPPRAPTILFAGRLVKEKGIFILLDAFARVRAEIPDARLFFVGEGSARAQLVSASKALGEAVQVLGAVKNRAMPNFFRAADVVAMPSLTTRQWQEQVGAVALQAMACGAPIVAARSGAIPEYVPESAGILVAENDSRALADALITVLRDESLRARMGRAGRAYACAHYNARVNIARGEKILEECVIARRV